MGRIVHTILPALAVFALASSAVALPPERPAPDQPAPGQPDEATMRRLATSATPPPLATARAKLNAALSQRLRAAAAMALNPSPPARPTVAVTPLATCTTTTTITEVRGEPNGDGTATPDNDLSIAGCHLGTTPGSATLVGPGLAAPLPLTLVSVCASPDFKSEISCWQDTAAVFHVPHLERVGDSDATLVVTTADGQTLRSPVRFVALRQTALVYGTPPISGKCSHATNNDDCVTTQSGPLQVDFAGSTNYSVLALHQSLCCFNGVRDHDDYQVALMAQWQVASVDIAADAQLPYCSNAFSSSNRPVSSATLEAPIFSADKSAASFRVDYSVGPVCSEIVYALAIVARGPLGTFYDVKPPTGRR